MIICSDAAIRATTKKALSKAGFTVYEAKDGFNGIALFQNELPDIILLDVIMTNMDGFTTCEAIRALPEGQNVPILMMTSLDDVEAINRAYEAGGTDFLIKPINNTILAYRIRYILRAQETADRLRSQEKKIEQLSCFDEITGLPNRSYFKQRLANAIKQTKINNTILAVLFIDLDHFKRINDTMGHSTGDKLLREVAKRLNQYVRTDDIVIMNAAANMKQNMQDNMIARLGGDEFVILLTDLSKEKDAALIAGRITQALSKPFIIEDKEIIITSSIGIGIYCKGDKDDSVDAQLKNADIAMYHAKENGRNSYQFFSAKLNQHIKHRLNIEMALRKALKHNELTLNYQPKVNAVEQTVIGMEALIRWHHPELGFVSPVEFIPIAEESGMIIPIGDWILETACRQTVKWQTSGFPELKISVNLSAVQFKQKNFCKKIQSIIHKTGIQPRSLELELTESLLMDDTVYSINTLKELRSLGIELSIDDFGTGYSSLSYLTKFPINNLKIDRSFVSNIAPGTDNAAIVTATIALARSLRMDLIAEGVEQQSELDFMISSGCHIIQGYFYSKPLPAREFTKWLLDTPLKQNSGSITTPQITDQVT